MHAVFLDGAHHMVLAADQSLEDDIVDSGPEQVHIDANLFKMLAESAETPLEAEVVLLGVLILHKVIILLVD